MKCHKNFGYNYAHFFARQIFATTIFTHKKIKLFPIFFKISSHKFPNTRLHKKNSFIEEGMNLTFQTTSNNYVCLIIITINN